MFRSPSLGGPPPIVWPTAFSALLGTVARTIASAKYAVKSLNILNALMQRPAEQSFAFASDLPVRIGSARLQDVQLQTPEASHSAGDGSNIEIPSGRCLARPGKVGCGKRTPSKPIPGLITRDGGPMLPDGIAEDPRSLSTAGGIGDLDQLSEFLQCARVKS